MSVTPMQRSVCAELLSRATRINSLDEAGLLIDSVTALIEGGERGSSVLQWLSLLPKARGKAARIVAEPVIPVADLPEQVQRALRPVEGESKQRKIDALFNPDQYAIEIRHCAAVDCGVEFAIEPSAKGGRRPTYCEYHRNSVSARVGRWRELQREAS